MSNQIKAANFYILVALFLSGCAGSGVKDVSQFMPLIQSNEESAVLVVRQTGFQGSGALVEVVVMALSLVILEIKKLLLTRFPLATTRCWSDSKV